MAYDIILPLAVMERLHVKAEARGFLSAAGRPDLDALLTEATEASAHANCREACWQDLQAVCCGEDADMAVLARTVSAVIHGRSYVQWPIAGAHYMPPSPLRRLGVWWAEFVQQSPAHRAWLN